MGHWHLMEMGLGCCVEEGNEQQFGMRNDCFEDLVQSWLVRVGKPELPHPSSIWFLAVVGERKRSRLGSAE